MKLKIGSVVSAVVAFVATGGIVIAFLYNSSPYVTVAEAKKTSGKTVNIVGDIDKDTLVSDPSKGQMTFNLVDTEKGVIKVIYSGQTPANMGDAKRLVAIGEVQNGVLYSKELRIKCPSKYESQKTTQQ